MNWVFKNYPIYNYISGVIHFRQWQAGLMDWLPRFLTGLVLFFKILQNDEPFRFSENWKLNGNNIVVWSLPSILMGVKPPTAQIGHLFVTTQRIILLVAGAGIEPATSRLGLYLSIELSPT